MAGQSEWDVGQIIILNFDHFRSHLHDFSLHVVLCIEVVRLDGMKVYLHSCRIG